MIEFLLLGIILGSIPLLVWYLKQEFNNTISKTIKIKEELTTTLAQLNEIHNKAVKSNLELKQQLDKLNLEVSALKSNQNHRRT